MIIAGLDVGSSGAKVTALDKSGKMLYTGSREYRADRNANTHEIIAADVWVAVKELLREAAASVPGLTAVGVISFGESFVLLSDKDEPLLPVMMYTDPRGGKEADLLREKLGDRFISHTAGASPHPMFSLPKLMWIKSNKPEIFAQIKHIFLIGDFIVYMLTGRRITDYSLAARTMGLDIRAKAWSKEIFEAAGIDPALFSKPVPAGTDAGAVLPEIARELGLPEGMRVVLCCHDQVAAALGSGVMRSGMAADGGGTVQCITPVFSPIPEGGSLHENHYPIIPFLRDDTYCCYAFSFTGGALVKWFADQFADRYKTEAKDKGMTVYQLMEGQIRDKPTGILVLPHFAGAATPYMDTGSKGAFVGLDLTHTPIDIFMAIMEGITYEMRLNIEKLSDGGIKIRELYATGGCAKSGLWLQLKADILGIPITRMSIGEAGTVGGIMLTGVAAGMYNDLEEAANTLVHPLEVYRPRREVQEQYERHYRRYRRLYSAVRPLLDQ